MWSTAPNTPTVTHKEVPAKPAAATGVSKGWHGDDGAERHGKVPKHISSTNQVINGSGNHANAPRGHDQRYPRASDVGGSDGFIKGTPEVISPSNHSSQVHRGFIPNQYQTFDATKTTDLPGSREVITTPPHPQGSALGDSRPRARSIEDVDKQRGNYVPSPDGSSGGVGVKEESTSYCLSSLSSLIGSQEEGRGHEENRKGSMNSEASTISVRLCYFTLSFFLAPFFLSLVMWAFSSFLTPWLFLCCTDGDAFLYGLDPCVLALISMLTM